MAANRFRALVGALCALLLAACNPQPDPEDAPTVLAAASLQEALEEVAQAWERTGHAPPRLSFAASSALARQIESGAPADVFISADEEWMDELERQGLLRAGTRRTLLGNAIVVVAPCGAASPVSLRDPGALAAALGSGRLAMADPEAVPAGRYGKAALERLGIWDRVAAQVAPAENVRAALALVERGQSPLGIVYATDALASDAVAVVARFPPDSHPPIRYPAAVVNTSDDPEAERFLEFLASDQARRIFARHGFAAPR